jgi:hypothetical protein
MKKSITVGSYEYTICLYAKSLTIKAVHLYTSKKFSVKYDNDQDWYAVNWNYNPEDIPSNTDIFNIFDNYDEKEGDERIVFPTAHECTEKYLKLIICGKYGIILKSKYQAYHREWSSKKKIYNIMDQIKSFYRLSILISICVVISTPILFLSGPHLKNTAERNEPMYMAEQIIAIHNALGNIFVDSMFIAKQIVTSYNTIMSYEAIILTVMVEIVSFMVMYLYMRDIFLLEKCELDAQIKSIENLLQEQTER